MKLNRMLAVSALAVSLVAASCVSVAPTKSYTKPLFDNSHAILIEKTVRDIDIVGLVRNKVKATDKIVITSIERTDVTDMGINTLIDDSFISRLSSAGMRILERDREMLYRIRQEQGDKYDAYALELFPMHPVYTLLQKLDTQGLDYLSPSVVKMSADSVLGADSAKVIAAMTPIDLEKTMRFYALLRDEYQAIFKTTVDTVKMTTADVLVSYRVLECGIVLDLDRKQETNDAIAGGKWKYSYKRNALARVFVRIVDAKTGEIRAADVLEKTNSDEVIFEQGEEETEPDFFNRMNEYDKLLAAYHFTFYEQQLPNKRGTGEQLVVGPGAQAADAANGGAAASAQDLGVATGASSSTVGAQATVVPPSTTTILLGTLGGLAFVLLLVGLISGF